MNRFTPRAAHPEIEAAVSICRDLLALCAVLVFAIGAPLLALAATH